MLQPHEYDENYFDGGKTAHPAGYTSYQRWYRQDGASSVGEYWKDYASQLIKNRALVGKKVLELGCAKGFLVADLRSLGIDASGIDVSSYAVNAAAPDVRPFLTEGDVRTALARYRNNEFDVVLSLNFLVCIAESELPALILQMNRIARLQVHLINETPNAEYYLVKPLSWWSNLAFKKNTVLVGQESREELIK